MYLVIMPGTSSVKDMTLMVTLEPSAAGASVAGASALGASVAGAWVAAGALLPEQAHRPKTITQARSIASSFFILFILRF